MININKYKRLETRKINVHVQQCPLYFCISKKTATVVKGRQIIKKNMEIYVFETLDKRKQTKMPPTFILGYVQIGSVLCQLFHALTYITMTLGLKTHLCT